MVVVTGVRDPDGAAGADRRHHRCLLAGQQCEELCAAQPVGLLDLPRPHAGLPHQVYFTVQKK